MQQFKTIGPACTLGEGPLWHPLRGELYWFDIPAGQLYRYNPAIGGDGIACKKFDEPASAAGWIDRHRLIIATASGLLDFNIEAGSSTRLIDCEENNPATRSNDGRIGPGGAFWFGTMADNMAPRAGAYYRYKEHRLETLFDNVSIPNATCFSPDNKTAYLADTRKQVIWRWTLDDSGAPVGEKSVHINLRDENLNPDGAVCDAEGFLWNAQWGASRVARYDPNGNLDRVIELPVSQPTCPAFGGPDLKTLYVTSAKQGLSREQLEKETDAGKIIVVEVDVAGLKEHQAVT